MVGIIGPLQNTDAKVWGPSPREPGQTFEAHSDVCEWHWMQTIAPWCKRRCNISSANYTRLKILDCVKHVCSKRTSRRIHKSCRNVRHIHCVKLNARPFMLVFQCVYSVNVLLIADSFCLFGVSIGLMFWWLGVRRGLSESSAAPGRARPPSHFLLACGIPSGAVLMRTRAGPPILREWHKMSGTRGDGIAGLCSLQLHSMQVFRNTSIKQEGSPWTVAMGLHDVK